MLSISPGVDDEALEMFHTQDALFAENAGQWATDDVYFGYNKGGTQIYFTDDGLDFGLSRTAGDAADPMLAESLATDLELLDAEPEIESTHFSLSFDNATPTVPVGADQAVTRFNYHLGAQENWVDGVSTYKTVVYNGLYDGIDLETFSLHGQMKYEFHVDPGADYTQIELSYSGIEGLSIGLDGSLHIATELGEIVDEDLYIYQTINGEEVEVAGQFTLLDNDTYTFTITGEYDPTLNLIIDPNLDWSTYLGGSNDDVGNGIAVDAAGNVLVTGYTLSSGWVSGGYDTNHGGTSYYDAFVVKLSATGSHLWSTYLGGSTTDHGNDITVDTAGNVLVTGNTKSSGWVSDGYNTTINGDYDAFVVKLSATGSHLWSTYLGGSTTDYGRGIAVDAAGNVLVTGQTYSSGWMNGGYDTTLNGVYDAFVVKLTPNCRLLWSTYLGGSINDYGNDIAVDAAGNVLVTGQTYSSGWVSGGYDTDHGGTSYYDAFVVKLSATGSHLWSTYLGGSNSDYGRGIAVDAAGNVLVTGTTVLSGWVWVSGGYDTTHNGANDAFVVKLSATGSHLWSTFLGGANDDVGYGIAVDGGNVLVTGYTDSANWFSGGFEPGYGGNTDAYLIELTESGEILWGSYLGGYDTDCAQAIAIDWAGNVLVTGYTTSPNWFSGGYDPTYGGGNDGFVAKISRDGTGSLGLLSDLAVSPADVSLMPSGSQQQVTAYIHNYADVDATDVTVRLKDLDSGTVLGSQVIDLITGGGGQSVSMLWSPASEGSRIEVMIDPYDSVRELSNQNNMATRTYGDTGDLAIESVAASLDGNGAVDVFGRFISGVSLMNTFTAYVFDTDVDHVEFTLGSLGTYTDSDATQGWTASFDVGLLSGDETLAVVAYDAAGNASSTPWTGTVHVVSFPSWLGTPDGDDQFIGGEYDLNGFFPEELNVSHTVPSDWWIIGDKESEFKLGVELGLTASLDASQNVPIDHELVFEAKILDKEIYGYSGDPLTIDAGDGVTLSFFGSADGDDLLLSGFNASVTIDGWSPFEDGSYTVPETSYTVAVPIFGVPVPVTVALGLSVGFELDAQLNLGWNLGTGSIDVLPGTFIEPSVSAEPYIFGGVGVPGFNAGLEAGGELGLHYRGEYDSASGYSDTVWGSFQLNFRAVATVGIKFTLGSLSVPSGDPWTFGDVPAAAQMMMLASSGETVPDVLAWPDVTTDTVGNVLLTRVVDADAVVGQIDPEIAFALRDVGGTWTALNPVTSNDLIESDPNGAFDGQGGAVVSWVANTIDPALIETTDWDVYLETQEIHSSYWDGTSWSTPQTVTSDAQLDGGPELAFYNGQGLMLWEHAGGTGSFDLDGFDIRYAVWDDVAHVWGAPVALTSDTEGDWAPTVAFGPSGQAMAVWVHDADGDPTTATLYYATWNGTSWTTPTAVPLSSTSGVREPRIAYSSAGDVLLAWVGNEGGADILYTSTWNHVSSSWSTPQAVPDTSGMIDGIDLDISATDDAMLVWHGWDGQNDLFSTSRNLRTLDPWAPPVRVTDNTDGEWMASTAFDSDGVAVTVWTNDTTTTAFGEGAEGVDIPAVPNLVAQSIELMVSCLGEGEEVRLLAEVGNFGLTNAEATSVEFYLGDPAASGTLIGTAVDLAALAPGEEVSVISDVFALPAGTNDYYAVVVADPNETEEGDNFIFTTVETDVVGPHVTVDISSGDSLAIGTSLLIINFDEPIISLLEGHISLVEETDGIHPPDHVYLSADRTSGTLIFEGGLAEGSYTLKVLDNVVDLAGNLLDGDNNASPGGDYSVEFSVGTSSIPGDANSDGRVDGSDVTILAGNWQKGVSDGLTATWEEGDFNADGKVDGSDVTILAGNWQAGVSSAVVAVSDPEPSRTSNFTPPATASLGIATVPTRKSLSPHRFIAPTPESTDAALAESSWSETDMTAIAKDLTPVSVKKATAASDELFALELDPYGDPE